MEWVETTGRSLEEAKEQALDQLGVAEDEAEFEVLDEPKLGLFGRVRREARVRARVQPRQPPPKVDRRRGRRRDQSGAREGGGSRNRSGAKGKGGAKGKEGAKGERGARGKEGAKESASGEAGAGAARPALASDEAEAPAVGGTGSERTSPPRKRKRRRRPAQGGAQGAQEKRSGQQGSRDGDAVEGRAGKPEEEQKMSSAVEPQEQARLTEEFLAGLVDAFGLEADVTAEEIDDETVEVRVDGEELGPLIGPKGQTLQAVQELARASVQRSVDAPLAGRVRLDIGGYRERRREALARFASQQAEEVREAGVERALEAMGAADRKVVHDTINEIDGVHTISEGEEPRRRVVIVPE